MKINVMWLLPIIQMYIEHINFQSHQNQNIKWLLKLVSPKNKQPTDVQRTTKVKGHHLTPGGNGITKVSFKYEKFCHSYSRAKGTSCAGRIPLLLFKDMFSSFKSVDLYFRRSLKGSYFTSISASYPPWKEQQSKMCYFN